MAGETYQVTDRRPIAARNLPFFQKLAVRMAKAGVSANAISVSGAVAAIIGGGALGLTAYTTPLWTRVLWLLAALCARTVCCWSRRRFFTMSGISWASV